MRVPLLACHLTSLGVDLLLFTGKWWLTLFTDWCDWLTVLRCWDVVLQGGREAALRISLALLDLHAPSLCALPFEQLVPTLLHVPASYLLTAPLMAHVAVTSLTLSASSAPPPTPRFARAAPSALSNLASWMKNALTPVKTSADSRKGTSSTPYNVNVNATPSQRTVSLKRSAPSQSQGEESPKRRRLDRDFDFAHFSTPQRERARGSKGVELKAIKAKGGLSQPPAEKDEDCS